MDKIWDILQRGIVTDLFKAEKALCVLRTIGKRSYEINKLHKSVISSFAYYQNVCVHEYISSIARVYDKPNRHNETRCLERLIELLKDQAYIIPEIVENYQSIIHLKYYDFPPILIERIKEGNKAQFTRTLRIVLLSDLSQLGNQRKVIKDWRDKILSHNDADSKIDQINFDETDQLLEFGWKVAVLIGWTYFTTVYGIKGNEILRRDARKIGYQLNHFIDECVNRAQQSL